MTNDPGPLPAWWNRAARLRDPRTVPLRVKPPTDSPRGTWREIRPAGDHFPGTVLIYGVPEPGRPHIGSISVDPEYRRRGMGSRLVERLIAEEGEGPYTSSNIAPGAEGFWHKIMERQHLVLVEQDGSRWG